MRFTRCLCRPGWLRRCQLSRCAGTAACMWTDAMAARGRLHAAGVCTPRAPACRTLCAHAARPARRGAARLIRRSMACGSPPACRVIHACITSWPSDPCVPSACEPRRLRRHVRAACAVLERARRVRAATTQSRLCTHVAVCLGMGVHHSWSTSLGRAVVH
jgi:hypothetical protein